MGMLRVMSRRGDDRHTWNQQEVEAGDLDAIAAVEEAKRIFAKHRAKGATAYRVEERVDGGKKVEPLDHFDVEAEQIVIVPQVVGG